MPAFGRKTLAPKAPQFTAEEAAKNQQMQDMYSRLAERPTRLNAGRMERTPQFYRNLATDVGDLAAASADGSLAKYPPVAAVDPETGKKPRAMEGKAMMDYIYMGTADRIMEARKTMDMSAAWNDTAVFSDPPDDRPIMDSAMDAMRLKSQNPGMTLRQAASQAAGYGDDDGTSGLRDIAHGVRNEGIATIRNSQWNFGMSKSIVKDMQAGDWSHYVSLTRMMDGMFGPDSPAANPKGPLSQSAPGIPVDMAQATRQQQDKDIAKQAALAARKDPNVGDIDKPSGQDEDQYQ